MSFAVRHTDSGVRIIMDPYGEDHDVLIEQHEDHWLVFVHPQGQDPVCIVELNMKKAVVTSETGDEVIRVNY